MEWAFLGEWIAQGRETLSSTTALRTYSWLAIATVFVASVAIAIYQLRIVRDFNKADIERSFPGARPSKPETIQRRIKTLQRYANNTIATLLSRALLMMLFGVLVPGTLLVIIAWHQGWLLQGAPAFQLGTSPTVARDLSPGDLALFVVDQALRGGLTDFFEVFALSVGDVTNNPDNIVFSSLVLGFRFLCGAVVVGLVIMFIRVALGVWGLAATIRAFEDDLEAAAA